MFSRASSALVLTLASPERPAHRHFLVFGSLQLLVRIIQMGLQLLVFRVKAIYLRIPNQ
jgi:hypothetical protein